MTFSSDSDPDSVALPARPGLHWPSIGQLLVVGLGFLTFLGGALTMFLGGMVSLFTPADNLSDPATFFTYMAGALLLVLLLLPSLVFSLIRLSGKEPKMGAWWQKLAAIFHPKRLAWLYPLVILGGYLLAPNKSLNWLGMPLLNVFAFGIPVAFLLWLGMRKLPNGSLQRDWGAFGLGLTIVPLVMFFFEIIAILFLGVVIIARVTATPELGAALQTLMDYLQAVDTPGSTFPMQAAQQLVSDPLVLGMILMFFSGFVPLIEETFKPLAVLFLLRRPLPPQDGWVLGMLSGAGFALVENLGNVAIGEGWAILGIARLGATALHIFASGLVGTGLVAARTQNRFGRLALNFMIAVVLHAVWNGVTVVASIADLNAMTSAAGLYSNLPYSIILLLLSVGMIASLAAVNRKLRPAALLPAEIEPESV